MKMSAQIGRYSEQCSPLIAAHDRRHEQADDKNRPWASVGCIRDLSKAHWQKMRPRKIYLFGKMIVGSQRGLQ